MTIFQSFKLVTISMKCKIGRKYFKSIRSRISKVPEYIFRVSVMESKCIKSK